ncbi:MAG: rhodanese-like domain-containing protein [Campylobacterota bacterium]|nr:rhodanese-like domain-containing protein [Campylobacterota bacterium]
MKKTVLTLTTSAVLASSLFALNVPSNHIVDTDWLKAHLGDKDLVIVDMRKDTKKKPTYSKSHIKSAIKWSSKEYREGRYIAKRLSEYYTKKRGKQVQKAIPGYIVSPKGFEALMQKSGINNKTAVVFYAAGKASKDYRDAAMGIFTSIYYGHDNVAILNGGFAGWIKDGGKTSSTKTTNSKGGFKIKKFNRDVLAVAEDIDEAVTLGNIQTVDTNGLGSHYDGTKKGDFRRDAEGHLPGAKAMHTKELAVKKDGVYYFPTKSQAEVKLSKAGISTDKPTILYCNTGNLAAGNWFVHKFIVGQKDIRVYNGSMADYTALPNRPLSH